MSLTAESVLELAPDPASAKAGRELSRLAKWTSVGRDARAAWGLCPGSGKDPYQTRIDLQGPAFKCSCPSRKFPCKHGIGLGLALAEHPEAFATGEAPGWVSEWIANRDQREERKAAAPRTEAPPDPQAQEKRQAARARKVDAGIADLSARLDDLLAQGLSWGRDQDDAWWEAAAARMVDAQAPGLAREIRALRDLARSGTDASDRMAEQVGRLHLLLRAGERRAEMTESVRTAIETRLGFPVREADLLEREPFADAWIVCGRRLGEDEGIRWRRTWLVGERSRRWALLWAFAGGREPLDPGPATGQILEGSVRWQPAPLDRRAHLSVDSARDGAVVPGGAPSLDQVLQTTAAELALDPLQELFPWMLASVVCEPAAPGFRIRDPHGAAVPLAAPDDVGWRLVAAGQGRPMPLFGEWDGRKLTPLAAFAPDRWVLP